MLVFLLTIYTQVINLLFSVEKGNEYINLQ